MNYLFERYGDLEVAYLPDLDGGGRGFGQDYLLTVKRLFGRVDRVFEFCAGPGFIGFSLLAHGLCNSLCLADVNPEAVEAGKLTVRRNNLGDRVKVYLSDGLDQIPDSERWDLVVSNPPHFKDAYQDSIRHYDGDWMLHKKFYAGVNRFLKPGASVLIQENHEGSTEKDFVGMIESGGLQFIGSFLHRDPARTNYFDSYYFVWSGLASSHDQSISAHSEVGMVSDLANTIAISLTERRVARVQLTKLTPHRFAFANHLGRPTRLMVYAKKFGILPRFLRTFGSVGTRGRNLSFVFQFYAGQYVLKDSRTNRTLCGIRAS